MRAFVLVAAWLVASGSARAQQASTGIVADRMRPAIGPTSLGSVEGGDTTAPGRLSTLLALGYLRDPIVLRTSADGALVSRPVRAQLVGTLGFELGLPRGFAIRASLPIAINNEGDRLRGTGLGGSGNDPGPALEPAVGDLSFGVKVSVIGAPSQPGLHAALALEASVPLGGQKQFAATDGPTIAPRLMIDYRLPWISIVIDAQARFGKLRPLFNATFGDELVLAGGVIGKLVSFGASRRWYLSGYAEVQGIIAADAAARPVEVHAALRLGRESGVELDLGGGAGVVDAVGAPRFRVFAVLRAPLFGAR